MANFVRYLYLPPFLPNLLLSLSPFSYSQPFLKKWKSFRDRILHGRKRRRRKVGILVSYVRVCAVFGLKIGAALL